MNKKIVMAIAGIAILIFTAIIGYKSLDGLKDFDFNDPFEVELDDE